MGQPKVLDFGLARLLEPDAGAAAHTRHGEVLGTLSYMAPEQLRGGDVDVRVDVWALGVILHRLLTGALPHALDDLALPEAIRCVQEADVPPVGRLFPQLRGDVETILGKALAREPSRRYQSAAELAEDVRRHLAREPIRARADSTLYVVGRLVRRHRLVTGLSAGLALLLVVFAVAAGWQARREASLRRAAQAALTASRIENARLMSEAGAFPQAQRALWQEWLSNPDSLHAAWALRELHARHPLLQVDRVDAADVESTPDGSQLLSAGTGKLDVWDARTRQLVASLPADEGWLRDVVVSRDGRLVAAVGEDGRVRTWSWPDRRQQFVSEPLVEEPVAVAFSADAEVLVGLGGDGRLHAWRTSDGGLEAEWDGGLTGSLHPVLAFAHRGPALAWAGADGRIRLREDWRKPATREWAAHGTKVSALVFSKDDRVLISGGADSHVSTWDWTSGEGLHSFYSPNGTIRDFELLPDAERIAALGMFRTETLHLQTGVREVLLPTGGYGITTAAGGDLFVICDSPSLAWWQAERSGALLERADLPGYVVVESLPGGESFACGDASGRLRLLRLGDVRDVQAIATFPDQVICIRASADGRLLAIGLSNDEVRLVTSDGRQLLAFGEGSLATHASVDLSRDGRTLAFVDAQQQVRVHDTESGELIGTMRPSGAQTLSVRFAPDGRSLVTAARSPPDDRWKLWRPHLELWSHRGEPLRTLDIQRTPWTCDFSPDGRFLATGSWGQTVHVHDLASAAGEEQLLKGHSATVIGVAFHPTDDRLLASTSFDGTVRLWDRSSAVCLSRLDPFEGRPTGTVGFSSDGRSLIVASFPGRVARWDLEYHDRHLAETMEQQLDGIEAEGRGGSREKLEAWAREVRARDWPRYGGGS